MREMGKNEELLFELTRLADASPDNGSVLIMLGHVVSMVHDSQIAADTLKERMSSRTFSEGIMSLLNLEIEIFEKSARKDDDILAGYFYKAISEFKPFDISEEMLEIYGRNVRLTRGLFWKQYAFIEISRIHAARGHIPEQLSVLQELTKAASYSLWEKIALLEISTVYRNQLETLTNEKELAEVSEQRLELMKADQSVLFHYLDKYKDVEIVDRLVELADIYEKEGRLEDAIGIYAFISSRHIPEKELFVTTTLGLMLYRMKRYDESIDILEKLVYGPGVVEPDPECVYHLGLIYEHKGLLRKALTIYSRLIDTQTVPVDMPCETNSIATRWGLEADRSHLRVAKALALVDLEEGIEALNRHITFRYNKKTCAAAQLAIATTAEDRLRNLTIASEGTQDSKDENTGENELTGRALKAEMEKWKKRMDDAYHNMIRNFPDVDLIDKVPERYFQEETLEQRRRRLTLTFSAVGALVLLLIFRMYLDIHMILYPVMYIGLFGIVYFFYHMIMH